MKQFKAGVAAVLVLVLLVLSGCGGSGSGGSSKELKKVTFRLNWATGGYHAPYYLAKEKGYFAAEGLDVEIQAGKGSVDTVKLVANGSADFGLADAVSIIPGKIQGMPIKAVGVAYQDNPMSVISLSEKNIKSLKDLEGKTFGAVPSGSPYILYKGLLKAQGVDASKIKEVTVDSPGSAQLLTKQVDAITLFYTEIYPIEVQAKQKLNVIKAKDNGLDIYGLAVFANEKTLQDKAAVTGFLKALKKGIEEAKKNPEAAVDIMIKYAPEKKELRDQQIQLLKDAFQVMPGKLDMDAAKWDRTQKVLFEQKAIEKMLDAKEYFDSSYLK